MMNLEKQLQEYLKQITKPNEVLKTQAQIKEDSLAKPKGTLGRLEELAVKMAAIQNTLKPRHENKLVVVCAADHGVVDEGVSPYTKDVTRQQIENFAVGGGAITVLSRQVGAKVLLLDVGVNYDFPQHPNIINKKIAYGTKNMAKEPAMTREQALKSILTGIEIVLNEKQVDIVAAGEMGIGNTTPSSAICSVLLGIPALEATGLGSGIDPKQLEHKALVIQKAIDINKPKAIDPIDVLAKVGGLEIGAMVGVYLGGAMRKSLIIIDGFIAGAAALLAEKIAPGMKEYFVAGHRSMEKAHQETLEALDLKAMLDLNMCLGEGSGAVIAMFLSQCAASHFNEMRTLDEAGVTDRPDKN